MCISNMKCLYEPKKRNWDDKKPAVHWIDWEKPRMTRMNQRNRTNNLLPFELWWRATTFFHNSLNKFGLMLNTQAYVMCNIGIMYELSWGNKSRTRTLSGSCLNLRQKKTNNVDVNVAATVWLYKTVIGWNRRWFSLFCPSNGQRLANSWIVYILLASR